MRFPTIITRGKNVAGTIVLFSEDNPTTSNKTHGVLQQQTNAFSYRLSNGNGWPLQRIVIGYVSGPVAAIPINATLFIYEDSSEKYLAVGAAKALTPGLFTSFAVPVIADNPQVTRDPNSSPGGLDCYLLMASTGADPDGTYVFVAGPDVSNAV